MGKPFLTSMRADRHWKLYKNFSESYKFLSAFDLANAIVLDDQLSCHFIDAKSPNRYFHGGFSTNRPLELQTIEFANILG